MTHDRERVAAGLLVASLVITIPVPGAAQDEVPGPGGERWDLTAYDADGQLAAVPWNIDATLLLEDGTASGSAGCNRYVVPPWDDCMNLEAGGTRIEYPTLYIAVLGPDDSLAKLTKWAEPEGDARPDAVFKHFRKRVDACGYTPPM